MADRKRNAQVELAANLRRDLAIHAVAVVDERARPALFLVYGAERMPDVGVVESYFPGFKPGEIGRDILGARQRIDLVVIGEIEVEVEPSRFVVEEQPVVAELRRVALAAALGRAEEVVEVR